MPGLTDGPNPLGSRDFGEIVTDRRSSWVRRHRSEAGEFHIKTYDYPTWGDRLRGVFRFTGPGRASRASREFDALRWLEAHLGTGVEAIGAWENRRAGFLIRAVLVTRTFPGRPLTEWLAETENRTDLAICLGRFVGRLHAHGFRDGNLDLRNLLAQRTPTPDGEPWQICKIDSPRYRITDPGQRHDAGITRDWQRLQPQLEPFGITRAVLQAAGNVHDEFTRQHRQSEPPTATPPTATPSTAAAPTTRNPPQR